MALNGAVLAGAGEVGDAGVVAALVTFLDGFGAEALAPALVFWAALDFLAGLVALVAWVDLAFLVDTALVEPEAEMT